MDLATIQVDKQAAREAFLEYRAAFREQHQQIDAELMRGYKILASGKQLIRLSDTIRMGGADDLGRPRLAIARADEPHISFTVTRQGAVTFSPRIDWWDPRLSSADRVIALGQGTLPAPPDGEIGQGTWVATMPLIPPRYRPAAKLENYHLLWEALWHRPKTRRAPRDPALLRRIGGDLFAVLAIWDLTELERSVLELRPAAR